jgi:hypothetical protein
MSHLQINNHSIFRSIIVSFESQIQIKAMYRKLKKTKELKQLKIISIDIKINKSNINSVLNINLLFCPNLTIEASIKIANINSIENIILNQLILSFLLISNQSIFF